VIEKQLYVTGTAPCVPMHFTIKL